MGANFFFGNLGKLCCVDKCCITETHFTVLRAFIMLQWGKMIPPLANLWLPNDDIIVVRLSVVDTWCLSSAHPRNGAPPPPLPPPSPQEPSPDEEIHAPNSCYHGTQTDEPATPLPDGSSQAASLKIEMTCRLLLST
jgi:hypothetical protein